MAQFSANDQEHGHFELFIDGIDFSDYQFISMKDENWMTLRGVIILNGIVFLDEGQELQWNVKTAEYRMAKKLGRGQKIDTLVLRNIDCSSGII